MGFGPPAGGLVFEEIFDGSVDAPTSFPWGFESPLPFTIVSVLYISQIMKNELDELYCYMLDRGLNFYKYNIDKKRWTKLAGPNFTGSNRCLTISPDGSKVACISDADHRLEIYDIATDTWTATAQAGNILMGAQLAVMKSLVWETDDKLWCWAKRAATNQGQCISYVISTITWWASAAVDTGLLSQYQGRSAAINPSGGVAGIVYGGMIGATVLSCCKYDINADSYSYVSAQASTNFVWAPDRDRIWYQTVSDYCQGYIQVSDDSLHNYVFPEENHERSGGYSNMAFYGVTGCIWHCRSTSPRIMSYIGTGIWKLVQKTWPTFTMVIIHKPDDGYAVTLV